MCDASDIRGATVENRLDEQSDASPSERVIDSIAALTGRRPIDLPPLYEAVEPEALDRVVRSGEGGTLSLSFAYAGTRVTFDARGTLRVRYLDD